MPTHLPTVPDGIAPWAWEAIGAKAEGADWRIPERSETGEIIGWSVRHHGGVKSFVAGGHRGLTLSWPLGTYAGSSSSNPLYVVEGATDAAAGLAIGLDTVGRPSAMGGVRYLVPLLRDRHVCVIAENDQSGAGLKGANQVASQLAEACASVRAINPPIEFKDLRQWIIGGVTRTDIERLVAVAPLVEPLPRQSLGRDVASVGSVSSLPGHNTISWHKFQPVPTGLPEVPVLDPDVLPHQLRDWVVDIADRTQCPIDYVACGAMVALATAVGRRLGIRPKRFDDWIVVPNLWGAVVGRPGVMKTPAIQEALKPLRRLDLAARDEYKAACVEAAAHNMVATARKKAVQAKIRAALKDSEDAALEAAREAVDEDTRAAPIRRRFVLNDSTVEKLGEILNETPAGVLVHRDELVGLLKALDKEGQEGARAFYLEAWNGTGAFTYDRIGRGTIEIVAATISVLGGIQPGPLGQYMRSATREGAGDDGLIQRFQLLVWPDVSKEWRNVDRWPDSEARDRAFQVFERAVQLDGRSEGAEVDPFDPEGIPFVRFTDEAQALFDDWRSHLELRLRSGELPAPLESHLAKYRSLVPSLALLIHLADGHRGRVGLDALKRAIQWAVYLEGHARRIYSHCVQPGLDAARALSLKIRAGEVADGFSLRDVYRKGWSALSSKEEVQEGVELLVDLGWLAEEQVPSAGRTARIFRINPAAMQDEIASASNVATDKGDTSFEAGASGGSVSTHPEDDREFAEGEEGES